LSDRQERDFDSSAIEYLDLIFLLLHFVDVNTIDLCMK
jgi:hypothetical protein